MNINESEIPCSYTIARYIPDLVRNEPINIGVVISSRDRSVNEPCFLDNLRAKLPKSIGEREIEILRACIDEVVMNIRHHGETPNSSNYFENLPKSFGGSLQFAPAKGILTSDPEAELTRLFKRFVAVAEVRRQSSDTIQLREATRFAARYFKERGLMGNRTSDVNLKTNKSVVGSKSGVPHKFDFSSVHNRTVAIKVLDFGMALHSCRKNAYEAAINIDDLKLGIGSNFYGCTLFKMPPNAAHRSDKNSLIDIVKEHSPVYDLDDAVGLQQLERELRANMN